MMWLIEPSEVAGSGAAPAGELRGHEVEQQASEPDELTESSTYTTVADAPADPAPHGSTDGLIVHPRTSTTVHAEPGGAEIARMEPTQINDTWLPIVEEREGWVRVLLPSRPNGSTGWLPDADLERAHTPYEIHVHLGSKTLRLLSNGEEIGTWTIGIGRPETPTPTGRTFLLGSFTDENQQFSPVILPLGAHSDTLNDYGGGPGTVAIHTWPTTDVLGTATSDGCVRVPQEALDHLTEVPLGTLVLVDQS
ncbi:L,D-transpeptidase [Haloechinothrix sp. LS1_15]|nr:L,D-transpeptidase [Haloechinothrix sp. LS1_15]